MSRFSRIRTIWRKEFTDTLRDRRTLIAMVLVPMVLYPALMLGTLQAFEFQTSRLKQERHQVGVPTAEMKAWLERVIMTDPSRQPFARGNPTEDVLDASRAVRVAPPSELRESGEQGRGPSETAPDVRSYEIVVVQNIGEAVLRGALEAGLVVRGDLPRDDDDRSVDVLLIVDNSEVRSQMAAQGLTDILQRYGDALVRLRLARLHVAPDTIQPLVLRRHDVAPPEKLGGSILGQIVPLILIIMTITGAIYPAIDLTAGERERGTLETLMVAPVPTVDLIAGKFVVVTFIGMLSAVLNLLSVGGTIYLGGLGELLSQGGNLQLPLWTLPWVLLVLIPLAVMFSALLLAVSSFARSFKEAQNYVMPVMIAALIPAVIGVLPGARLEGPLLVMPVANIVVLTRELFTGVIDPGHIVWVSLSTCLYAGAAVAVAAKLFGQEAVLFADSGSIRTIFLRRFFRPADQPTAAQAFLLIAVVYLLNFFVQQSLLKAPSLTGGPQFFVAIATTLIVLFVLVPLGATVYMRVRPRTAFALLRPTPISFVAATCFGLSSWILASAWFALQERWLPMPAEMTEKFQEVQGWLDSSPLLAAVILLAMVPAICEELFFRGYAFGGLRRVLGAGGAMLVTAAAFALNHHSVHRLVVTFVLGVLMALLVWQGRSIWPAILAHVMHNGLTLAAARPDGLQPLLQRLGYTVNADTGMPPYPWLVGAAVLCALGALLCLVGRRSARTLEDFAPADETPQT